MQEARRQRKSQKYEKWQYGRVLLLLSFLLCVNVLSAKSKWHKHFHLDELTEFNRINEKRLHTFGAVSVGEILAVSGYTFTSRLGMWINTWNKEGKKINTRAVRQSSRWKTK